MKLHRGPPERGGWDRSRVAEFHFGKTNQTKQFLKQVLQKCVSRGGHRAGGARKAAVWAECLHNHQPLEHRTEMQHGKSLPGKWQLFCSTKPDEKILQKGNAFSKLGSYQLYDSRNSCLWVNFSGYFALHVAVTHHLSYFYSLKFNVSMQKEKSTSQLQAESEFCSL